MTLVETLECIRKGSRRYRETRMRVDSRSATSVIERKRRAGEKIVHVCASVESVRLFSPFE